MWRERLRSATSTTVPGTRAEHWIFWCLIALAAVLRMWDLPRIPFMHDEISALVRLYPTLGETIRKGVIEQDTHPPGVQVFEWLWTRAFGSEEWVVKLPFMLMSIAALFFLYRLACAWTNATVALIALALFASLQYFVLYGQLARPYAFGLFTTALMADQLTRYVGHGRRRALTWTMIAGVLSAYTHHFALMQAGLVGTTGLLLIQRERRGPYLIACGIALAAYLPNVPILIHQFAQGGLTEWLSPPDRHWLGDYAWWVAHCSRFLAAVLIALIVFSLAQRIAGGGRGGPFWWIALLWGAVPLVVGYAYSVWRAPVIQYSMLIFSFPLLAILLLSGIRPLPWKRTFVIVAITAGAGVFTLITTRLHYALIHRSKYEALIEDGMKARAAHGNDCLVLLDAPDHVIRFYMERRGISDAAFPYANLREAGPYDASAPFIFYGHSNSAVPERPGILQASHPRLIERHDFAEGQTMLFGRGPSAGAIEDHRFTSTTRDNDGRWSIDAPMHGDTIDLSGREFGVLFKAPLDGSIAGGNDLIEVTAEVHAADPQLALAVELRSGDRSIFYRAGGPHGHMLHTAIPLSDIEQRDGRLDLQAYLWNRGSAPVKVGNVRVEVREGNPVQYGFYRPITEEWKYR